MRLFVFLSLLCLLCVCHTHTVTVAGADFTPNRGGSQQAQTERVIPAESELVTTLSTADEALYAPVRHSRDTTTISAERTWAHSHWVWLGAFDATGSGNLDLIHEYLSHDIPVGAVDFDSNWESGYSNLQPNTKFYPNMNLTIQAVHQLNVRVIVWATSMIDTDANNYQTAKSNNYFILNGLNQTGVMKWWHGWGSLLDYTNPAAVSWWHGLQDSVYSLGIDGWKTDGTDPFIMELIQPRTSDQQPITYREYADATYGDWFDYARARIGPDALIMSRPVDTPLGSYLGYSPLRVMTSGWVGDNDASWDGLIDCAKKVLQSAWRNYANFGCDIGGYRSGNRTRELLLRWAAFGAFLPLMENGGDNDHRPWSYDVGEANSTLATDMYRLFVQTHESLSAYLLSVGSLALETEISSLTPLAPNGTEYTTPATFEPDTYAYLLGPTMLVQPILAPNVTLMQVYFPMLDDTPHAHWVNMFDPTLAFPSNATVWQNVSLDDSEPYPVYHIAGSILPLRVSTDVNPHHGSGESWKRATAIRSGEKELGVNARREKEVPLTLYIPFTPSTLSHLSTHPSEILSTTVRRFQSQSIDVSYELEESRGADATYLMRVTISPTLDDSDIILVIGCASNPIVFDDADIVSSSSTVATPMWSSSNLNIRITTEPDQWHQPNEHANQDELHLVSESGMVIDEAARAIIIKPNTAKRGARIEIAGLAHRNE